MIRHFLLSSCIVFFLCYSCKDGKKEALQNDKNVQENLKDISELSYQEIFYLLHDQDEYGVDYHGEVFGQDASGQIDLVNLESDSCGNGVALKSTASQEIIKTAVRVSFNFPGNPSNEFHRLYTVKPGEILAVGHSKLCYNGSEYVIQREVVSAGFDQPKEN